MFPIPQAPATNMVKVLETLITVLVCRIMARPNIYCLGRDRTCLVRLGNKGYRFLRSTPDRADLMGIGLAELLNAFGIAVSIFWGC
jgi:hypothetical protein